MLAYKTYPTYSWEKTTCNINDSWLHEGQGMINVGTFTLRVVYGYQWEGKSYTSEQFAIRMRSYYDIPLANQTHMRYAPGDRVDCYVNPNAPSEAILDKEPVWIFVFFLLGVAFGLFLAVSGGFMIYQGFFTKPAVLFNRKK